MADIGNVVFIFALIRLIISFLNWACRLYLPTAETIPAPSPSVSILIPARNEEENIARLLADLSHFDYPNLEILVYDDRSTDDTAAVVQSCIDGNPHITLLNGTELPQGWLGKNYACHQLARAARGEMLLFIDADVRLQDGLLSKAVNYIHRHNLKLLSIFPKQIMPSTGSSMAVPLMNRILLSLLFLPLVRLTHIQSFSAANGQFMFFDGGTYRSLWPHSACRDKQVEDMAIIKILKKRKLPVATLLGGDDIRCRMYSTLNEAVEGFSKNVFSFFGGSILLTYLFAIVTTVGPFWLFIFNGLWAGLAYIVITLATCIFVSFAGRQSVIRNMLLLIPQQIVFIRIIYNATLSRINKKMLWKGRNIYTGN